MDSQSHNETVSRVIRQLEQRFYRDIHANHNGHAARLQADAQLDDAALLPDVMVGSPKAPRHLIEVEVEETLSMEKTTESWKATAEKAERSQGQFWIAVPKGFRENVSEKIKVLGINAKIWEV